MSELTKRLREFVDRIGLIRGDTLSVSKPGATVTICIGDILDAADELERLQGALEAIAEVGSGYGGRKVEEEKIGYSTTTGEGHMQCRDIADAALAAIRGNRP